MRRWASSVLLLCVLSPDGAVAQTGADSVDATPPAQACRDCDLPHNFWRAGGEFLFAQLLPWGVTRFVRNGEWARIGPSSWARNLGNPWKWDNNGFSNNQISHPLHGNLYFNSARTNGYGFWTSMGWAFAGSLMWEYFGEVWAPAPNDLVNTSMGGITIGESLYRLSSMALDNTSTGVERALREGLATVINPFRGFNRILDGRAGAVGPNPPDWRPSKWRWSLDAGYRRTSGHVGTTPNQVNEQAILEAELDFGDSVEDLDKAPFSFLEFFVGLGQKVGRAGTLQDFRIRGSLAAATLHRSPTVTHRLAAYMTYDYYAQPSVEYGAQGFQGGLVSRWGDREGLRFHTEVLGVVQPIAALQSDYFLTLEGRDYDYGLGLGAKVLARLTQQGFGFAEATGSYTYTPILSGFDGGHHQWSGGIEAKAYPVAGLIGAGGSIAWYHRSSKYTFLPDISTRGVQTRVFLNFSAPRWTRP